MIISLGKSRLRLKLSYLEAEFSHIQSEMALVGTYPRSILDQQASRQGKIARIKTALEILEDKEKA